MDNRVERFKTVAQERWEQLEKGDSKKGNKCYDELQKIANELEQENSLSKLDILLEDENKGVQYEAATKLLVLNLEKAVRVLENLSIQKGILPFTARQTLKYWRNKTK